MAAVFVSSKVSKTNLKVGESFTYTLTFEGLPAPIPQPFLPAIEGAAVKGQYQSAETGKTGRAFLYHYIISPAKSGRISLGDFTVRVENQSLTVSGFSVNVGEAPAAKADPPPPSAPAKEDIFLEGRLAKNSAYVGEGVVYTLHLLTRESIRNFEFVQKSEFDGFRKIETPSSRFPPTAKVTRNGKIYLDATILKCVLFPLKSGDAAITPFTADIKVQGRGDSSNPIIRLKGGEASLRVEALPEPPPGFSGAIGSFKCEYAGEPPGTAKVGEPFSVDVSLKGEGTLSAEPFPAVKSPFFSSYPSTFNDRSPEADGSLAVDRTYHLSWVPSVAGTRQLPDINFVFFDPAAKQFRRSALGGITLTVAEGAKAPGRQTPEILPLLPVGAPVGAPRTIAAPKAWWILLTPFFFLAAVFGAAELLERFVLSPEKKRLRQLTSKAVKEFRNARSNLDARKSKAFHNHLKKSLEAVLEIKTGQPVSSLTIGELREKLRERGTGETEADALAGFSEELDAAAFSNEQPQKTELRKKLERMRGLIKKRTSRAAQLSALILALAFHAFPQGQSSILTSRAEDEFSKRNFGEALKYYRIIEDSGNGSPALYYDIGNCHFESGNIPEAILYYKRALKADPSLRPAKNNLSVARSLVPAKASPYEPSPLESFLLSARTETLFYCALILLSLSCLTFCVLRVFNVYFARTAIFRAAVVLLAAGIGLAALFFMAVGVHEAMKEAIALAPAPVFQKPDPSLKPIATLPEGSEIYVTQSSGKWLKARWGEGEGWTYSDKIGIP